MQNSCSCVFSLNMKPSWNTETRTQMKVNDNVTSVLRGEIHCCPTHLWSLWSVCQCHVMLMLRWSHDNIDGLSKLSLSDQCGRGSGQRPSRCKMSPGTKMAQIVLIPSRSYNDCVSSEVSSVFTWSQLNKELDAAPLKCTNMVAKCFVLDAF